MTKLMSEKQSKYLNDLRTKYAITIDMSKVITRKDAFLKISQILDAIQEGRVKLRSVPKTFEPICETAPVITDTSYDAQKDFDNQPQEKPKATFKKTMKKIIKGQITIDEYLATCKTPENVADLSLFNDKNIEIVVPEEERKQVMLYGKPYRLLVNNDPFDSANYKCSSDYYNATAYLTREGEDLCEVYREMEEFLCGK
jgi:hypothetical protein